jgi:predicted amino acid-binding ACT domain protein
MFTSRLVRSTALRGLVQSVRAPGVARSIGSTNWPDGITADMPVASFSAEVSVASPEKKNDAALLVTLRGTDEPGITAKLSRLLGESGAHFLDVNQAIVHGQLSMFYLLGIPKDEGRLYTNILFRARKLGMDTNFQVVSLSEEQRKIDRDGKNR